MPIEPVPGTDLSYHLIAFDADGRERTDDRDGTMSERATQALVDHDITDVFIFSHGWMGDVPAARRQYAKWVTAMTANTADLDEFRRARPRFDPLLIGLHWPSRPWGDEELGAQEPAFDAVATDTTPWPLVDAYAERIANTPAAREALETIFAAASVEMDPVEVPGEVLDAYALLDREAGLGSDGPGGAPGADREPFDPEAVLRADQESMSFGGWSFGGLLAPLRALSFWKMKERARRFGELGARHLLNALQDSSRDVAFHLMGHSFGCIVVSAMVTGRLTRPIHSMALMQGALSLWSYCSAIPVAAGRAGAFSGIAAEGRVSGPIVTTQSIFDSAVGRFYPIGAAMGRGVDYLPGELPRYGALGAFGAQGPGLDVVELEMLGSAAAYHFAPRHVYNLDASRYIRTGSGSFGAHSDLAHAEVTHAVWAAAMASLA
jgi:hypothetical protein